MTAATSDQESRFASEFLGRLHEEKMAAQARRGGLVMRKLSLATALSAVGWAQVGGAGQSLPLQVWPVLFLPPFVATLFDLYIVGENHGIKRMGVFVRGELATRRIDGRWETFLSPLPLEDGDKGRRGWRDRFSSFALPFGSWLVLAASSAGLWLGSRADPQPPGWFLAVFVTWFCVTGVAIGVLHCLASEALTRLDAYAGPELDAPQ